MAVEEAGFGASGQKGARRARESDRVFANRRHSPALGHSKCWGEVCVWRAGGVRRRPGFQIISSDTNIPRGGFRRVGSHSMKGRSCAVPSGQHPTVDLAVSIANGADAIELASKAQQRAWSGIFDGSDTKSLVALGDSLLAGMGCQEKSWTWKSCAYPARLVRRLNSSCANFDLINRA